MKIAWKSRGAGRILSALALFVALADFAWPLDDAKVILVNFRMFDGTTPELQSGKAVVI